jgi:hypothetical protein
MFTKKEGFGGDKYCWDAIVMMTILLILSLYI